MQAVRTSKFINILVAFAMVTQLFIGGGWLTNTAWAKDFTDSTTSPSTVTIYTDADHTKELDTENGSITADQTLYGNWHIKIAQIDRPSAEDNVIKYTIPSDSVKVQNDAGGNLTVNGVNAGTWAISNNTITITCDKDWLATVDRDFEANIAFDFTLANQNVDEDNPAKITFPGSTGEVTIPVTEKDISGSKSGSYNASDNTITWSVYLNPQSNATNVTVTDTIGSNLSFVSDSFKLDGNSVSATTNGKTASIALGSLSKGSHTLTYTTTVDDLASLDSDGKVTGVDNAASWTWGKDGKHKSTVVTDNGPTLSYNMVKKGGTAGDEDGTVSWTVTLNNGSLKADMADYVFTDTLDEKQEYAGSYTVRAEDGTQTSGSIDEGASSFTYTFPANAGKQSYTITYTTKYKAGVSTKKSVTNTAGLTPSAGNPGGSDTATYGPTDNTKYVAKERVDATSDLTNGKAGWKTTINFSEMDEQPETAVYTDTFGKANEWSQFNAQNVTFEIAGITAEGLTFEEGTDYSIENAGNSNTFKITFTQAGLDKIFSASPVPNVEVVYTTQLPDGDYTGTFQNSANIKAGSLETTANAEYSVEGDHPMVKAVTSEPTWNADYENADGTKGAYIVGWTVYANKTSAGSYGKEADLHGATVKITDDLAGMAYVADSASYTLVSAVSGEKSDWNNTKVAPTFDNDGKATFSVDTSGVVDDNASWHGWVVLTYKTAVKASEMTAGETVSFKNDVTASADGMEFDEASATASVKNNVVTKAAQYNDNDAVVDYTVNVNPGALDLEANSDKLTMSDVLSSTGTFQPSTFKVYAADGSELDPSQYSVSAQNITEGGEIKTQITVTIPDSQALKVCYSVKPTGTLGDTVTINNSAALSGYTSAGASNSIAAKVANARGSITAASDVIQVTKYAQDNISQKLSGAEFTLYKVKTNAAAGTYSLEKEKTATTDSTGVAQFGTANIDPLETDVLYCVKETKAPSGYKVSDAVYYVVLRAANDTELYNQIASDAKACGITEGISTSNAFTYFDEESDTSTASCDINISKTVNGANPKDDEQFSFEISAVTKDAPMPSSTTVTTKGAAVSSFEGLEFTEEGTYEYTIHETTNAGDGWTNAGDITAKVVVSKADDGTLSAAVDYTGSAKEDSYVFNNTYAPKSATATIKISKSVIGDNADANEQFKFELFDENNTSKGEVTCKAGETKSFETVSFNKVGVYNYTIKETSDLGTGWKNETGDVTAKITVSQNETTRDLEATVEYTSHLDDDATVALIKNSYTKPEEKTTTATINISKSVQGDNASADEQFTFDLYKGEEKLGTVTTKAGEIKGFDAISFTESDLDGAESKDFTYTIKEQAKTGDAWFDVTGSITAKVTLSKDASGDLQAVVDYSTNGNEQQNAYLYTNKYSTATATIGVSKEINGANPTPDEQFTFDLYKGTDKIDSVSVKGGNSATYKSLTFDSVGEYTYAVKETAKLGWANLTGDVTATVNVARDTESNELKATVTYTSATEDKSSALFTNKYSVGDATATIKISKNVIGDNANENEQFKFELFDSEDKSLGEVTCKGGETKSFADLTFSKTGTYTYKIKETSDLGHGWSNETGDVTATVTVSQNQETGNLEASVEYTSHLSDDATTALITNKYEQPKSAEPTISVNKKVAGDNAQPDEKFTFELQDENSKKVEGVDTIELKADETKSFTGLKLDKEGTFTYTIHETSENGEGWTNAQDVTATVVVKYNKDANAYEVESVTYSTANDEKNAAFFLNKYEQPQTTDEGGDDNSSDETEELSDDNGGKKAAETVNPKTGDDSPAGLFAGLAALSALVAGASAYGMRRTRKSN